MRGLPSIPITHLLLEYLFDGDDIPHTWAGSLLTDVSALVKSRIAPASPASLQWIGLNIRGWTMCYWTVTRSAGGGSGADLVEMDEREGRRILETEGMATPYLGVVP